MNAGSVIESALVQGSLYALVGVGFVVLFRATRVLNFAQGSFMVLGGFVFYGLVSSVGTNVFVALFGVAVVMAALGYAIYQLLFRRMIGVDEFTLVIATFGLGVVIQTVTVLIWGADVHTLPIVLSLAPRWNVASVPISAVDLCTIVVCVLLILALQLGLQRTTVGVQMRATSDNASLASYVGIKIHRTSAMAWSISAVCSGIGGACLALGAPLDPINLQGFGLAAFAAILLGGLDSFVGALIGGMILGFVEAVTLHFLGGYWAGAVSYMILLAVLFLRPQGILGSPAVRRL